MSLPPKSRKPVPRGCALLIGIVLFVGAVTGLIVLWNTLISGTLKVRSWERVPCTVLKAETESKGTGPQGHLQLDMKAELTWEYKGIRYTGGRLDADTGFHAAETANAKEELCHNLRQNPQQTCYVNPGDPAEAILRPPEWWPVLLLTGLAAMSVVVGAVVVQSTRRAPGATGSTAPGCLPFGFALIAGLALAGGGVAIWCYGIRDAPDWKVIGARMKEVPCTVAGSSVREERNGRQNYITYRPQITFRYEWDGRAWHSEWFNFNKTSAGSRDRDKAAATVQHYGRGSTHLCWVDPEQPWVAVLEKSGAGFPWQWIIFVLCLSLGGSLLVALTKKGLHTLAVKRGDRNPPRPPPLPE